MMEFPSYSIDHQKQKGRIKQSCENRFLINSCLHPTNKIINIKFNDSCGKYQIQIEYIIYSLINKLQLEVQWEDNYWYDCITKKQIILQKCQNAETNWEECNPIPNNGGCLNNGILKQFSGQGNFMIYTNLTDSPSTNLMVNIDGQQQTLQRVRQENYDTYSFNYLNSFTTLKVTGQGYIQRLDVSSECLINCQKMSEQSLLAMR
ncbi:hypothetical protein pb186bvf_019742 [Paramecium bursaria]